MALFSSPAKRGRGTTRSVVEGAPVAQAPSVGCAATSPATQGRRRVCLNEGGYEAPVVAVGVRGAARRERWAAWLDSSDVLEQLKPVDLTPRLSALSPQRLAAAPALAAAAALDAAWPDLEATPAWGPTGSVGFELASERPIAHADSDLDAIIRCPAPVAVAKAQTWLAAFDKASFGVRCDVLLETPMGGVALLDYVRSAPPMMLRTGAGPRLVHDPWAELGVPS